MLATKCVQKLPLTTYILLLLVRLLLAYIPFFFCVSVQSRILFWISVLCAFCFLCRVNANICYCSMCASFVGHNKEQDSSISIRQKVFRHKMYSFSCIKDRTKEKKMWYSAAILFQFILFHCNLRNMCKSIKFIDRCTFRRKIYNIL